MSQRKYEEFQAFCYKRKGHSIRVQDRIKDHGTAGLRTNVR